MLRLPTRLCIWPLVSGLMFCVFAQPSYADSAASSASALFLQAESSMRRDHPRFVETLAQIQGQSATLSVAEQWHLRYLEAWETMYEGNYTKSEVQLRKLIADSGDAVLETKASAQLLMNLGLNRRYEEAFALANRLTAELPEIRDTDARYSVLNNLSQMLDFAGQTDLAIKYARMMEEVVPSGEGRCLSLSLQVAALYNAKRLHSTSPELQDGVDACADAQLPVIANTIQLVLGSIYLDENQPGKAMTLLDRITPSIGVIHYYPHMLSAQAERAQAYAKLGNDEEARKAALAAVATSHPGDISDWLMVAYDVLYQVEKRQGNTTAALGYYEQYVAQDKGYLNDISAKTLAYATAQQHMLVQKLETETLSKQNNILRLQQALDFKAVETSRLYIVLLLTLLASIVLWLYRLKRSQLRFKRLSHHDSLTDIFNHQHFISASENCLRVLEKKFTHACLILIDLDHFKQVNDEHGHAMGDAVLRHTVMVCKQHLRPLDLFGRLGGEEFGILLHDCSRTQGMEIANRIRIAIGATPMEKDGKVISISASVGLAASNTSGYRLHQLCIDADAALYRAKRAGRNRVISDTENDGLVEA